MAELQHDQTILLDFKQSNDTILKSLNLDIVWQKEIKTFLETFWNKETHIKVKTSGSTSKPKTIALEKQKILASAKMTCNHFNLTQNSTGLLCLSPQHIAGKMMLVRAYHTKMKLYCVKPCSNPLHRVNTSIDFCAMVPYQVRNSFSQLEQIKQLLIGGAPLFEEDIEQLKTLNTSSYLSYGMTETISHIAIRDLKQSEVYHCLGDVRVDLDNRSCLTITSSSLIGTKRLKTNDVCEKIDSKTFLWKGRFDNVINSGGIKLFPEEIEQKIADLLTDDFYITSTKNSLWGELVTLVHVEPLSHEHLERINHRLSAYEKIKKHYHQPIQKTSSGKIIRLKF